MAIGRTFKIENLFFGEMDHKKQRITAFYRNLQLIVSLSVNKPSNEKNFGRQSSHFNQRVVLLSFLCRQIEDNKIPLSDNFCYFVLPILPEYQLKFVT